MTPAKKPGQPDTTRPTSDRVREALFNILSHHDWAEHGGTSLPADLFDNAHILDAFAGTGALAFDSLSRGAAHAYLIEQDRAALASIRENVTRLGLSDRCTVIPRNATTPPRAAHPCTVVFLDPPYRKNLIPPTYAALCAAGWIAPEAVIVLETAKSEPVTLPPTATPIQTRTYGDTDLRFFIHKAV